MYNLIYFYLMSEEIVDTVIIKIWIFEKKCEDFLLSSLIKEINELNINLCCASIKRSVQYCTVSIITVYSGVDSVDPGQTKYCIRVPLAVPMLVQSCGNYQNISR